MLVVEPDLPMPRSAQFVAGSEGMALGHLLATAVEALRCPATVFLETVRGDDEGADADRACALQVASDTRRALAAVLAPMDLSRFCYGQVLMLSGLSFEGHGAFPTQC